MWGFCIQLLPFQNRWIRMFVNVCKFLCLLHFMLSLFHSLLLRSHSNLMQQARIITRRISYKFKYTYIYAKEKDKNKGLHSKTCK